MATDFREALLVGEILKDEFIVDAHAHMDTWYNFHIPEQGTPASMVHALMWAANNLFDSPLGATNPSHRHAPAAAPVLTASPPIAPASTGTTIAANSAWSTLVSIRRTHVTGEPAG